jgi:hypothetical protein
MTHILLARLGQKITKYPKIKWFTAVGMAVVAALSFFAPQSVFAEAPLSQIVNPRIIGTTLKYAEYQIGSPAMLEWEDPLGIERKAYEKGECRVVLGVKNSKVVSVSIDMSRSSSCDFDAGALSFNHLKGKRVTQTTINDWLWRGRPTFSDPMLPSCNACQESLVDVYALFEAVGAVGNLELQVGSATRGAGRDRWRELLYNAGIDGDKLPMTTENCPLRRFDSQALSLMGAERVATIAIGQSGTLQPACSGAASQRPREN